MNQHTNNVWPTQGQRPAAQLVGMNLPGGWQVKRQIHPDETQTSETFSLLYVVESESQGIAFLKAMDLESPFEGDAVISPLLVTLLNFEHERNLLEMCARQSRVIDLLDSGDVHTDPENKYAVAYYLIFEWADDSVTTYMRNQEESNVGQLLQLMHQVTVALQQVHGKNIAHLDIKPSNIMVINPKGAKLADLGRSIQRDMPSSFDNKLCVGDLRFSPLELMYSNFRPDWNIHRIGCDFYMLGNILYFLIMHQSITISLLNKLRQLNPAFYPPNQEISYETVSPHIAEVFPDVIQELRIKAHSLRVPEIANIVSQLCDPNPANRGLPMNRGTNRYTLRRFVTKFNLLYTRNKFSHLLPKLSAQAVLS